MQDPPGADEPLPSGRASASGQGRAAIASRIPALLTTAQVAEYYPELGTAQTIARMRRDHCGPPFYRWRRRCVYRRVDVEEWIESQRVDPAKSHPAEAVG